MNYDRTKSEGDKSGNHNGLWCFATTKWKPLLLGYPNQTFPAAFVGKRAHLVWKAGW